VQWAFRAFLGAVLCYIAHWRGTRRCHGVPAGVAGFALVLAAYVALITVGPPPHEPRARPSRRTGQKIIVGGLDTLPALQARRARHLDPGATPGDS